jgi:predicted transcriptional regulator
MAKTLINLDPDDKNWLDQEARRRRVPMTELVRQAVRGFRAREESAAQPTLIEALTRTAGLWRRGDGLAWQTQLRREWDRDE